MAHHPLITEFDVYTAAEWTKATFGSTFFPWQEQNPLNLEPMTNQAILSADFGEFDHCDQCIKWLISDMPVIYDFIPWSLCLEEISVTALGKPGNFCWSLPLEWMNRNEAKGDLVMLQTLLLFKCKLLCYHANWILVSITTRSPSASLQIKGLATKYTTVKWPIVRGVMR